jgi:hypothetical protein
MKTFSFLILATIFTFVLTGNLFAGAPCDPNDLSALNFLKTCSDGSAAVAATG